MNNVAVKVRVGKIWTVYAVIPERFADLYVKYAISRGYRDVVVEAV